MSVLSKLAAVNKVASKVNDKAGTTTSKTETPKTETPAQQPKKKLGRRQKARQKLKDERERLLASKQLVQTMGGE